MVTGAETTRVLTNYKSKFPQRRLIKKHVIKNVTKTLKKKVPDIKVCVALLLRSSHLTCTFYTYIQSCMIILFKCK